jgi:hypothetical protein
MVFFDLHLAQEGGLGLKMSFEFGLIFCFLIDFG